MFAAVATLSTVGLQSDSSPNPTDRLLQPIVDWIMGLITAAIAAVFVSLTAGRKLSRQRNAKFRSQYVPGFRQFLAQCTPALQNHFNAS
jgi:hypothetical protein